MPRYRKKPVEVEAIQFTGDNAAMLVEWIGNGADWYQRYLMGEPETKVIEIPTLEGTMEAVEGDWIIQGVQGEFYPCKPDIFDQTYESVLVWNDPVYEPTFEEVEGSWQDKWERDHIFTPKSVDGFYVIGHSTFFGDKYKLRHDVLIKFYTKTVETADAKQ